MKLLLVEDEVDLLEVIRESLEKEFFVVEAVNNYADALSKLVSHQYDCVLLDIMLPDGNGLDLLAKLKQLGKSDNVIIISAKDSLEDKLKGLQMGADDYLVKPFHIAELNARIKSVLRRKFLGGKNTMVLANAIIDMDSRQVAVNGVDLAFNRKEFDILSYLAVNSNRLVNKVALAEQVWGDYIDEADDFEFIYSQIKNLRKKLKDSNSGLEIKAVYGVGYKLIIL
ncbi:MAG: response regulator transcription factor [Flavobacteriales bacterium]|nr:MAG: response regulator transcription factor [Flavobacteriales bacterium]